MNIKKTIGKLIENKTIKNLKREITKYVIGKKILDDGCCNGSFIYEKHKEKEIYGIDIKKMNILNRGAKEFKIASSTKIPYKKDSFDCVVFAGVIQYIKDYKKSFLEIKRVLKKDGRLIIATVNRESLFRRLRLINPAPKKYSGEYQIFSFKEIINLLKNQGFIIIKVEGVDFIKIPLNLCSNILIVAINKKIS